MAKRKQSSKDYSKYALMIIGLVLIVVSVFVLVDAGKKEARCESIGGKIIQIFDTETLQSCDNIWIFKLIAYIGIALGVALSIIGYLRIS